MKNIEINWEKRWGLIPTIIQDYETLEVLTLAYSSAKSFKKLQENMQIYLYSTSRKEIWYKWWTSWNTQEVKEILVDCDNDALVVKVIPKWDACHLGERSCFSSCRECRPAFPTDKVCIKEESNIFQKLENIISDRLEENNPDSYTVSLKWKNWNKVLEKIIEEAGELILAIKDCRGIPCGYPDKKEIIWEFGDLLFHSLVALNIQNIKLSEIEIELDKRFNKSWILEKKLRNKKIVIIDYGSGNIRSLWNALTRLWVKFTISSDKKEIEQSDLVFFPWVWNAQYAMKQLKRLGLVEIIQNYKKPFLWICLWMQLLFEKSEEWNIKTLWMIPWKVKKFENLSTEGFNPLPIPHMWWNETTPNPSLSRRGRNYYYFIHSYYAPVWKYTIQKTNYITDFSSWVQKNNFTWVQFHPEKSWKLWEEFLKKYLLDNL